MKMLNVKELIKGEFQYFKKVNPMVSQTDIF